MEVAKVLIIDGRDRYLMLYRANHPYFGDDPDLAGGTIEAGELPAFAAVREVEEEIGIKISQAKLRLLYQGTEYSLSNAVISLYCVKLDVTPQIVLSWEHASYQWLSRETFLKEAKSANDSYMHMVYAVLAKTPVTE